MANGRRTMGNLWEFAGTMSQALVDLVNAVQFIIEAQVLVKVIEEY